MSHIVDARGKSCPLPIVLLARTIRDLDRGETLVVQANDRAFPEDAQAWCRKTGNELVAMRELDSFFEATVRKG